MIYMAMADADLKLQKLISGYIFTILSTPRRLLSTLISSIPKSRPPVFVRLASILLDAYFRFCGLSPFTVDLDSQTTVHFWTSSHRRHNRPNLVLVHGFGGDARWQFCPMIRSLAADFNLYVPDLLFFGRSFTRREDRTVEIQARSVMEGLMKGLGVERCAVFAISYGGWVGYRMADLYPEAVEKVVIVSSGVGYSEEQKREELIKLGVRIQDLLIPKDPSDLRMLVEIVTCRYKFKWVPDFFLRDFIQVINENHKEQRTELVEYMLAQKADSHHLPLIKQKTLLIWGDNDKLFPEYLAHQLKRHLGPKATVEIINNCGHAANIDAPGRLNHLIKSFVLGHY